VKDGVIFMASTIRSTEIYQDQSMGDWAANKTGGIRHFPYSLVSTVFLRYF
jgi:hypothetical protein